jgi:hypothetical protein
MMIYMYKSLLFFSLILTHSISYSVTALGCSIDTSSECTVINMPPSSVPLSFLYTEVFWKNFC